MCPLDQEHVLHTSEELVFTKRLLHVIVGTRASALNPRALVAGGGKQDDRDEIVLGDRLDHSACVDAA